MSESLFKGYHHIGLIVTDFDRSLKFYQGLGGTVLNTFNLPGKTICMVDLGGGAVVELITGDLNAPENEPRWAHIALATDDTKAAFDLAVSLGAKVRSEPREGALPGEKPLKMSNCFVLGPDDEVIEFFNVL